VSASTKKKSQASLPRRDDNTLPCGRPKAPRHVPPSETQLQLAKNKLSQFLRDSGLKYTEQRWQIAQTILKTGGHLDSQQIVDVVKKHHPEIGAATVYRSIKLLCDANLLERSHQSVDGKIFFELPDDDHHDHIICMDCGEIFEFKDMAIESGQERVANTNGFQLRGHRHVIHGACDFLQQSRKDS
jgi:Fur family ferric uptake transcriptional regulator